MDLVLVGMLMELLLGLLCRAVMLLSAGSLLTGTWAGLLGMPSTAGVGEWRELHLCLLCITLK